MLIALINPMKYRGSSCRGCGPPPQITMAGYVRKILYGFLVGTLF
jgi:hypothetical protein